MSDLEKNIYVSNLFDFYKNLLTEKQQSIFISYYFNDIGLSEIAQTKGISRQAVLDSLKTPIEERIKSIIRLLNTDKISFIEGKTKSIVEALQTALYDEKSPTGRWIDDGKTSDIDSLDSFVYSWEKWMNSLMRRINSE